MQLNVMIILCYHASTSTGSQSLGCLLPNEPRFCCRRGSSADVYGMVVNHGDLGSL